VCARENDITVELLRHLEIPHTVLAESAESKLRLPLIQLKYEFKLLQKAKKIQPDVLMAIGEPAITHVGKLLNSTSMLFTDTEHSRFQKKFSIPFASKIYTPDCFKDELGEHHVRYSGYHELAYLHPNQYKPDVERLMEYGIQPDKKTSVVRFVGWNANHDVGQKGFSKAAKKEIVALLDKVGDVYISAEGDLPSELEEYRLPLPPHLIHDLLATAEYYIGDSGTMATEAALLGTPSIRSNSFVEDNNPGVFEELQNRYNLVYTTADEQDAIRQLNEFIDSDDIHRQWEHKRAALLEDKIDTTEFIVEQLSDIIGF
jgi:predicted glycosyltransferase